MQPEDRWSRMSHAMTAPRVFGGVFFYVLFAGLLLQKVVLPLTLWHVGHGLLAGGTLYRMRYPAVLLLCAPDIWGWSIACSAECET
jgi:hypothetical protein